MSTKQLGQTPTGRTLGAVPVRQPSYSQIQTTQSQQQPSYESLSPEEKHIYGLYEKLEAAKRRRDEATALFNNPDINSDTRRGAINAERQADAEVRAISTAINESMKGNLTSGGVIEAQFSLGRAGERQKEAQQFEKEKVFKSFVEQQQKQLPPGEKLVVDYKNMNIVGVESSKLQQTISAEKYNEELQRQLQQSTKQSIGISPIEKYIQTQSKTSFQVTKNILGYNEEQPQSYMKQDSKGNIYTYTPVTTKTGQSYKKELPTKQELEWFYKETKQSGVLTIGEDKRTPTQKYLYGELPGTLKEKYKEGGLYPYGEFASTIYSTPLTFRIGSELTGYKDIKAEDIYSKAKDIPIVAFQDIPVASTVSRVGIGIADFFVPTTTGEAATFYGGYKLIKGASKYPGVLKIAGGIQTGMGVLSTATAETPEEVGGGIAETSLGLLIGGGTKTTKVVTKKGYQPTVSISEPVVDVIEVQKLENGKSLFVGEAKTKIVIKDKEGKIIDVRYLYSETTKPVEAYTKDEALKVVQKEMVHSYTPKGGERVYSQGGLNKITLKNLVLKSEGSYSFVPGKEEGTMISSGAESRITSFGDVRLRADLLRERIDIKTRKTKTPTDTSVLSNIFSKQLSQQPSTRKIKGVEFEGEQSFFENVIRSDIYPETYKVKGYGRRTFDFGGFIQRPIKPVVRKYRKEQKRSKDLGVGIGSAFEPRRVKPFEDIGFKEVLPKENKPNIKSSLEDNTLVKLEQPKAILKEKQGVVSAITSEARNAAELISKDLSKKTIGQRTKKVTKVTGLGKVGRFGFGGTYIGFKTEEIQREEQLPQTRMSSIQDSFQELNQQNKPKGIFDLVIKQEISQKQTQMQRQDIITGQKLEQPTKQIQQTITTFGFTPYGGDGRFIPRTPKRPPIIFGFEPRKPRRELPEKGYDVYVKSGGKFKKANTSTLNKTDALSRGAYLVDNSTAQSFKISPSKKRVTQVYNDSYFNQTRNKFRQFKQQRGQRVTLTNSFIEKKKNLVDTRNEVMKLPVEALIQRRRNIKARQSGVGGFFGM